MAKQKKSIAPKLIAILLFLFVLGIVGTIVFLHTGKSSISPYNQPNDDGQMPYDLALFSEETYDSVLLSMHATNSFSKEDFSYFSGLDIAIASHAIQNVEELSEYLDCVLDSDNLVTNIHLCLDPELLWSTSRKSLSRWKSSLQDNLYSYIDAYPDISFKILLPYPYIDYWLELEQSDLDTILTVYHTLVNELSVYPNASTFFPGYEQWLILNPDNYTDICFEANKIITQKLYLYTFCDNVYQITPENEEFFWNSLRDALAEPYQFPDLSDWCLVFFGDSVLANFPGSFSIPGYVTGLSHAVTYNYAVGGSSAASPNFDTSDFPNIMDTFFIKNVTQSDSGFTFTPEAASIDDLADRKLCFIINYGLNDYYCGHLIENAADPYDMASYKGSLRTCISRLQSSFPDACCIIVTPTVTGLFNSGRDINSTEGDVFSAYIEAAIQTADEMGIYLLDNYHDFIVTEDNLTEYLPDLCHPNEKGRLAIALRLMHFINEELP